MFAFQRQHWIRRVIFGRAFAQLALVLVALLLIIYRHNKQSFPCAATFLLSNRLV